MKGNQIKIVIRARVSDFTQTPYRTLHPYMDEVP